MERVLPLFIHQLSRGEPITVYGGDDKVLDFTYIDDCVDGIARGIERLAGRATSTNETINLAYGQGNTLVRAAELIAGELGVDAGDHQAAVARRRGDALRRRHPQGARAARLAAGRPRSTRAFPRAVEWFRDWRAAHPDEDRPIVTERVPGEIEHAFKPPAVTGV